MPVLGLGTYKTAGGNEVVDAVLTALESGARLVDTAALYANDEGIGQAVRSSGVPRDDVFVTSKVWNDDLGYGATRRALERSLELLGFDHLDLYLIHWPVRERMAEAWRSMEEALDEGLVRAIGVSNFLPHHLDELALTSRVQPMLNQFEFHPRLQQPEVVEECFERGIVVQSWRPIMRGTVGGIPEIARIAEVHSKTPVQITIRWVMQRGLSVIPKSSRPERIRDNFDVFDFELTADEMALMDSLDTAERLGKDPDDFSF